MAIIIQEVKTKKQFRQFIDLPYRLYKGNPYFVPPLRFDEAATLNKSRNPAFEYCEARYWLAYRDGIPVGRIAGILNKAFIDKWKKNYVRFGWMDFEEDEQLAAMLVNEVEKWAVEMGMEAVHGPLGFTDMDPEGMLIEGFERIATVAGLYNHPYYPAFMEKVGYRKDADWIEFRINVPNSRIDKLDRLSSAILERYSLSVAPMRTKKDVLQHANEIFDLINSAYHQLYGAVPITETQKKYYTKQYLSFIRPDFMSMVKDRHNHIVAVGITMPSLSAALQKSGGRLFPLGFYHLLRAMKKNDTADLLLVAVRPDMQGKGVNAILIAETMKSYLKNGVRYVESNYQLEDNKKVQAMFDFFDKELHKRRRCYIKYLREGHA